jgi:hypothetical protein
VKISDGMPFICCQISQAASRSPSSCARLVSVPRPRCRAWGAKHQMPRFSFPGRAGIDGLVEADGRAQVRPAQIDGPPTRGQGPQPCEDLKREPERLRHRADQRRSARTIHADRPIVFYHSLVWLLHTAQVTALRCRHRLPQIDIGDHDGFPTILARSTTTISPCPRSFPGMDQL